LTDTENNSCMLKDYNMMTRKEYLDAEDQRKAHRQYYGQFVTEQHKSLVLNRIADIQKLKASKDSSFNDIPLVLWDRIAAQSICPSERMRSVGDFPTLSGGVCILKEAARQLIES